MFSFEASARSTQRGFSTLEILIAVSLLALFFPLSVPTLRSFFYFQREAAADEAQNSTVRLAESSLLSSIYQSRSFQDLPTLRVSETNELPRYISERLHSLPLKSRPAGGSAVAIFFIPNPKLLSRVESYSSALLPTHLCAPGGREHLAAEKSLWFGVGLDGVELYSGTVQPSDISTERCATSAHEAHFERLTNSGPIVPLGLIAVQDAFVLYRDQSSILRRISLVTRESQPIVKGMKEFRIASRQAHPRYTSISLILVAEHSVGNTLKESPPYTVTLSQPEVFDAFRIFL